MRPGCLRPPTDGAGDGVWIGAGDPVAVAAAAAIEAGDLDGLRSLLDEHPHLARARIGDRSTSRTLLHTVADWPGHHPNGPAVVGLLVAAGADVDARFAGPHTETPLHWAASSDDVAVLDALLDAGADPDAPGAVLGGGAPLADAVGFGQWHAARRLVERGASTRLQDEAALGLTDRLRRRLATDPPPGADDIDVAFWNACAGGQLVVARILLDQGADVNWAAPWDGLTPLDAAVRAGAHEVAAWLRDLAPGPPAIPPGP